ncbi:MAG: MerR family transcriptional regulator [Polyangiales bacterium]
MSSSERAPLNEVDDERDPDGIYPMRVVTRLTGLTADTIRVWERRYRAVTPGRTEGNARRYSDAEVKRLLLLKEATNRGHSIGEIGNLEDEELMVLAKQDPTPLAPRTNVGRAYQALIDEYLDAALVFDVRRTGELLARASAVTAPRELVMQFIVPLLREIGARWERGELGVAHEHMVSSQVKGLLGIYVRLFPLVPNAARIVIGTPEKHLHEFGAVIATLLASTRGLEPVFIGPDIPYAELGQTMRRARARILLLAIARDMDDAELRVFADAMRRVTAEHEVWIGCPEGHGVTRLGLDVRFFHDFEALDASFAHHFYTKAPIV